MPAGVRRRRAVNREGLEAGKRSTRTILWILLAASLVLYGFPFLYLLLTSFKPPIDTIAVPPTILPREWTLVNYVNALGRSGVVASIINSTQTAVISTLLSLVLAVPAAYGITRYKTASGQGVHHGGTRHTYGPAGGYRHPAGLHDGLGRACRYSDCPVHRPHHHFPSACPSG